MPLARSLLLLTLALIPASASAQSGGELLWQKSGSTSGGEVALGQRGTVAFATPAFQGLRSYSLFAQDTTSPIWTNAEYVYGGPIAAQESDEALFSTLNIVGYTSSQGVLHLVDATSGTSRWTHAFPVQLFSTPIFDISDDGQTIASGFVDGATGNTTLALHDPQTGALSASWPLVPSASISALELTPDGSHIVIGGGPAGVTQLLEIATGQFVFSAPGGLLEGPSIARNAQALIVAQQDPPGVAWHTRLYQRQGAAWVERLSLTTPVEIHPKLGAVSADGSVAVVAWGQDAKARKILRAFDVETGAMTMQRTFDTQGNLANVWTDIDISADGSRFAVSMWGDQPGTLAELAVYSPLQSAPVAEFPTGKTVVQLDLSNDGRHLLASRANGHVNSGYTALILQAYRIGSPDLRVVGKPSFGTSYSVEFEATPTSAAFLLSSPALASDPVDLAGLGTLQVDRAALTLTPIGTVPAGGTVSTSVSIPVDTNLIGTEVHHQGFSSGPSLLTEDFASVLILP